MRNCRDSDDDRFLPLCMTHSGIAFELPSISRPRERSDSSHDRVHAGQRCVVDLLLGCDDVIPRVVCGVRGRVGGR
jgi:hypothetical protein